MAYIFIFILDLLQDNLIFLMKAFSQFLVRVIKYKMDLLEYIDKYIKLEEKKHFFSGSILPNWSEIEIGISKYFLCYC